MYDTNATVPISEIRTFVRKIAVDSGFLRNQGGTWRFNSAGPSVFTGLDTSKTYQSEDEALDTILGVYFPSLRSRAA